MDHAMTMMETLEIDSIRNPEPNLAVVIRNAYKSYSPTSRILNGLNMSIPEGSIYGLLGPSGCGKTTLLNCIVGRIALDAGTIKTNIRKRVDLGYMPQSLSLHSSMSIYENIFFYAYLHGMESQLTEARIKELTLLLDLPADNNCLLCDLSGGIQRRVSIAVAIIHDPKFIILDEPTAGLDPLLSQSIWEHLLKMTACGKTIILTTHYIQEASQAHVVGLLRNGKLLAEENPQILIEKSGCENLEDTFLKLCENQETEDTAISESLTPEFTSPKRIKYQEDDRIFSRKKFKAILYKSGTLMKREYTFLLLLLVLPFAQTFFFYISTSRKPINLKIAILNDETPISECKHHTYNSCFLEENRTILLSCLYLSFLEAQTYKFIEYYDDNKAIEDLRRYKVHGVLHFHENYTHYLSQRLSEGRKAEAEHLEHSNIDVWLDLSDVVTGNIIKYDISRLMTSFLRKIFLLCGENPKKGSIPVLFHKPIFGTENEEFVSYTSSAWIAILCFFFPATSTAVRLFMEKKEGILERMLTAGASINELIASILLVETLIYVLQYSIIIFVSFYMFDTPHHGNFSMFTCLMLLTAISGMFYGIDLAVISDNLMLLGHTGMGTNILVALVSGLLSPTESAHYLLKTVHWMFPLSMTIDAARGISEKSFSFTHPAVLKGFAGTLTWGFIFITFMFVYIRYKKNVFIN